MPTPVITPIDPTDGEIGVEKNAPVSFTVVDSGLVFDSIQVWVKGSPAFDNGVAVGGWAALVEAITDGYKITLSHPTRSTYFEDGETVGVRAYAEDAGANSANEAWTFNVTRDLGLRIYPMLFEGARKVDESN